MKIQMNQILIMIQNYQIKQNCLLWILSGQVYNIPLKSKIKIQAKLHTIRKNQTISRSEIDKYYWWFNEFYFQTEKGQNNDVKCSS